MSSIKIKGPDNISLIQVNEKAIYCSYINGSILINREGKQVAEVTGINSPDAESMLDTILDDYLTAQANLLNTAANVEPVQEHYSTFKVVMVCLVVLVASVMYTNRTSNTTPGVEELNAILPEGAIPIPGEEYYVDEEFAQKIMNTKVDTEALNKRKKALMTIWDEQSGMTDEERKKYLSQKAVKDVLAMSSGL